MIYVVVIGIVIITVIIAIFLGKKSNEIGWLSKFILTLDQKAKEESDYAKKVNDMANECDTSWLRTKSKLRKKS